MASYDALQATLAKDLETLRVLNRNLDQANTELVTMQTGGTNYAHDAARITGNGGGETDLIARINQAGSAIATRKTEITALIVTVKSDMTALAGGMP